jgi:phosphate/sulfate permease
VGATVARPNALLAGAVSAFAVSIVVYLVARYYGYPLSGTESIAAFVGGWILGIIFDFMRVMVTGKRS